MLRQQHKIKKGLDTLAQKNKSAIKPFKKFFIGIPKNLIRIGICLFILSFLYIGYILTSEELELDFLRQVE